MKKTNKKDLRNTIAMKFMYWFERDILKLK